MSWHGAKGIGNPVAAYPTRLAQFMDYCLAQDVSLCGLVGSADFGVLEWVHVVNLHSHPQPPADVSLLPAAHPAPSLPGDARCPAALWLFFPIDFLSRGIIRPCPSWSGDDSECLASTVKAVRLALIAVGRNRPGGQVLPVEVLRTRVHAAQDALHQCRKAELSAMLPGLIRDVHTSIACGRDVAELLDVAVLLHVQAVSHWLREVGAPLDLRRENDITLTYRLAEERDTPIALGLAAYGATRVMLAAGVPDMAQADLSSVEVPTTTAESMQLAGMLAKALNPEVHPYRSRRSAYWRDYGRGLAQLRGRHDDAVRALRHAEEIHPHRVQRDPFVRDILAVLLRNSRQGSAADQELRDMARRAGLPI